MNDPVEERRQHYLNVNYGLKSWLFTTDHKRIAWLYLLSRDCFSFSSADLFATLIRLELLTPQGDLVQAETYNKLFTMHGVTMIFFFLIPSIPAVLGKFSDSDDDRRAGPGFSAPQSGELVYLYSRRLVYPRGRGRRRGRYRLDVLHAVQQHLFEYPRVL